MIFILVLVTTGIFGLYLNYYFNSQVNIKEADASQNYVSGVVSHHLLAESVINSFFNEFFKNDYPREIILVGPDHFNAAAVYGNRLISVSTSTAVLGGVAIDSGILALAAESGEFAFSDYAVKNDHGIMNIIPFIREKFPSTKIVPILIPANFPLDKTKEAVEKLNNILPENSFVLASVDWSHYLSKDVADFHDQKSIRTMLNFEEKNFSNIEVDCPQCLFMARYFAKLRRAENYKFIDHKNSQDFSSNQVLDSTTSYFSVLFSKRENYDEKIDHPKTVLFLGDVMLDRAVKRLMDKNGISYPFEKIKNFLKGADVVVVNLEGPIVENPQYTPDTSMKFNFGQEILQTLHYGKINLVSLANNHTLDKSKDGLTQTREILTKGNINYFGDPISCSEENISKTEGMVFVGLNKTFPANCSQDKIKALIEKVKKENSSDFITVFIHWGEEYKPTSNIYQKELAHSMIDAGADLIIGSHPHVTEEIERYKNSLIFYSLGNFIFDQYFSADTQKGLGIGLEIYENKTVFNIFPVGNIKSQAYLLENSKKKTFLEELSLKSSEDLREQIKKGIIEIDRKN